MSEPEIPDFRSREWLEYQERQICNCERPHRLRRYLGHWLCGNCTKLARQAEEAA